MHPAPASITKIPKPPVWDSLKTHTKGAPVVAQRKWIRLGTVRLQVPSLASLRGLRIRRCRELWCRSQTGLGSRVAVAMVQAGSCIADLTPSLGTSICRRCSPEKKAKKKTTHTHTHTHTHTQKGPRVCRLVRGCVFQQVLQLQGHPGGRPTQHQSQLSSTPLLYGPLRAALLKPVPDRVGALTQGRLPRGSNIGTNPVQNKHE